jgi:hypothetical protein
MTQYQLAEIELKLQALLQALDLSKQLIRSFSGLTEQYCCLSRRSLLLIQRK